MPQDVYFAIINNPALLEVVRSYKKGAEWPIISKN